MIIKELFIDDEDTDYIDAISLVNMPAIETDFMAFNSNKTQYTYSKAIGDKMEIIGPALIKRLIYRWDPETGKDYYVYFSEKTIKKLSYNYMKKLRLNNATIDHKTNADGISIVESWLIEDTQLDKSKIYGFDLPKGTWMIKMKVDNAEVWERVKSGSLKGFSIECWMSENVINKLSVDVKSTEEQIKAVLNSDLSDNEKENIVKRIIKEV